MTTGEFPGKDRLMYYGDNDFVSLNVPEPPKDGDPTSRLRHTLEAFKDAPDSGYPIVATQNVYADGITTGVTWADLREILRRLDEYER